MFVDFDGVREPEEAARELAGVWAFGTVLIALGSDDTARLARSLLRSGFSDCRVKPLAAATVRAASSKAMEEPLRARLRGTGGDVRRHRRVRRLHHDERHRAANGTADAGRTATVVDLDPLGGRLATRLGGEPRGDLVALDPALPEEPGDSAAPGEAGDPGLSVPAEPRPGSGAGSTSSVAKAGSR